MQFFCEEETVLIKWLSLKPHWWGQDNCSSGDIKKVGSSVVERNGGKGQVCNSSHQKQ